MVRDWLDPRVNLAGAELAEAVAEVGDEEVGNLERGEVPTLVLLAPVADVGERLLDPLAHRRDDLFRVDGEAGRDGDVPPWSATEALPVDARRRRPVAVDPV